MTAVSIVTPHFNHSECLLRLFGAVSNQTFSDFEWVIIDDCSTDNSRQVLDELVTIDPRIRLIQNEVNKGPVTSGLTGLEACVGEYVYFVAADDLILPEYIDTMIRPFIDHPEVQMTTSIPMWTDEDAQRTKIVESVFWGNESRFFSPKDFSASLSGGFIAGHATMYRNTPQFRELFRYLLSIDVAWYFDWLLNLHLAFKSGVFFVNEFNALMVNSDETFSSKGKKDVEAQIQVFRNLLDYLLAPEQEDSLQYWIESSAMSHFGMDEALLVAVYKEKKYWSPVVQLLLAEPLFLRSKKIIESVKEKIARTQEKFLDNPSQATMLKIDLIASAFGRNNPFK